MRAKDGGIKQASLLFEYQCWKSRLSREDRNTIKTCLKKRKYLLDNGYESMAKKIEKMLKQEFPSIPEEAFND